MSSASSTGDSAGVAAAPHTLDVSDVIGNASIERFHIEIFALCMACLMMDGFDVQALGYVAPALIEEWKIAPASLGAVFGAGNFGVLIGSLSLSILADKVGRRPVLLAGTLIFSSLTLFAVTASTVNGLLVLRFLAGLGLGCIIPNATALIGEYSPRRLRVTLMGLVSLGFTIGAALGGFVAAWLIPKFGWRAVFYVGGGVPLVTALVMYFRLPESIPFLILRGREQHPAIAHLLKRIAPSTDTTAIRYAANDPQATGMPFSRLFREGRGLGTISLWIVNFMNLLNAYLLSSWLTTVARETGLRSSIAVLVGTTLQVGGICGTLGLMWLISRHGFARVLTASFALGSLSVALIGQRDASLSVLFVVVFAAGACIIGGQPALNALAGSYYPTYLRSTGIGWALGVGRVGAIVGPVVAGEFIRQQWTSEHIFRAAAIPALISAAILCGWPWLKSAAGADEDSVGRPVSG
jgi:AAHS family 4-hydroxybenzoate transporter-like MFS transporter